MVVTREPELGATKRVRRFVRGKTAIGQRKKGGLNNMDWKLHAEAFYAEWIVRYLQPPKSAWKDLLDQFIVFDKRGIQQFSTARSAVLNPGSRLRYLQGLPKKAKYIRRCFMAFWKMGIKQDLTYTEGLKGESIWNNPRGPIVANPGHKK